MGDNFTTPVVDSPHENVFEMAKENIGCYCGPSFNAEACSRMTQ